jgi:hypothetical protein
MMIYIKSILAGTGLLIGCVALFTFALFTINIDLRAIMDHFPFISLPIMLAIFVVGFLWQFRRTSKGWCSMRTRRSRRSMI